MHAPSWRHRLPVAVALLVAVACGSESPLAPVPAPSGTLAILPDATPVFPGDALRLYAVARDGGGREQPSPVLSWSVSDTTIAVVSEGGVVTALRPGLVHVAVRAGELSASADLQVRQLTVLSVEVLGLPDTLPSGDVMPFGVRVTGEGGRRVTGRTVALEVSDSSIARIDPSGRLRTMRAGSAGVIARVDGVQGTRTVVVSGDPVSLPLRQIDGVSLPALVAVDTVEWDGVPEYAEVYLESGSLQLSGGTTPRYGMIMRYVQYAVTRTPDGQRRLELRAHWSESDLGLVTYDARGELAMTSEVTAPLSHTATANAAGFTMRYRVPGDDFILSLFFRREPR